MLFYKRIDKDGKTTTVESYSHSGKVEDAIKIDEVEYNTFIDGLPVYERKNPLSIKEELDAIKERLNLLERS